MIILFSIESGISVNTQTPFIDVDVVIKVHSSIGLTIATHLGMDTDSENCCEAALTTYIVLLDKDTGNWFTLLTVIPVQPEKIFHSLVYADESPYNLSIISASLGSLSQNHAVINVQFVLFIANTSDLIEIIANIPKIHKNMNNAFTTLLNLTLLIINFLVFIRSFQFLINKF